MTIKVFKISTLEMYTFKNKQALIDYIMKEFGYCPKSTMTIKALLEYFPKTEYCEVE